ncbi:MAG: 4-hydroxy-tetrahydrodipicolinate synthase [Planctomycetota bacterium]
MKSLDWMGDGLGVALATPFLGDGSLDEAGLIRLVQHVVRGGADFVVSLGSTGEASMLDDAERERVIARTREHCGPAALVIGTGASSTKQALTFTRRAAELGASAALVVVPPYTKPTQDGIVAHYAALADAVPGLPLIAYNVPSRTGVNLLPQTVARLWQNANVVALKESSGNIAQISRIAAELPRDRALLAGDDGLLLPTVAVGGHGVVSVAGNVVPTAMRDLLRSARAGDLTHARALQATLEPLFDALALESNPIPVKAALDLVGVCRADMRLPLLAASTATRTALQLALRRVPATAQEASHHA